MSIVGLFTEFHEQRLDMHDVLHVLFSEHHLSGQGSHGGYSNMKPSFFFFSPCGLLTDGGLPYSNISRRRELLTCVNPCSSGGDPANAN